MTAGDFLWRMEFGGHRPPLQKKIALSKAINVPLIMSSKVETSLKFLKSVIRDSSTALGMTKRQPRQKNRELPLPPFSMIDPR